LVLHYGCSATTPLTHTMASLDTPEALEVSLANVRRLSGSNLAHQSKPAQLLIAIESSLQSTLPSGSTSTAYPPTAYFVALLQCLEKAINDEVGNDDDIAETENMGQGALIPATLYLLAIIVPETPAQVALSKLSPLLESILPLFDTALEHPPALRSLLQITTALILFAPPNILNNSPLLKKSWNYCLELNLDPRPKVRHLAQEGVRKVLTTPVPPKVTAGNHPYLARAREWVTSHLEEETKAGGAGSKKKARFAGADDNDDEGKKVIWIVQGLRGWVAVWGDDVSDGWLQLQTMTDDSNSRHYARACCPCHPCPISPHRSTLFSRTCFHPRQRTNPLRNLPSLPTCPRSSTRSCPPLPTSNRPI